MALPSPRVEALFHEALAEPAHRRRQFVAARAGGDTVLLRDVLELLDHLEAADDFLEQPVIRPGVLRAGSSRLSPPAELDAGASVDGYRVLGLIAEGGMGAVYLAEQPEPVRRRVAIKVVKLGMDSKQIVARFEQERQAVALMQHPSIASVFDGGCTADGRPYFVMEYVDGAPITAFCDRHRLPVADRLQLFLDVCRAVQHAHQQGIVHRDLKPSNILISGVDPPIPKIIDFGIAKALFEPLTDRSLHTRAGVVLGTPDYMSPEQADPSFGRVDTRADIYSLGVVLHELLVGEVPRRPATTGGGLRGALAPTRPPSVALPADARRAAAIAEPRRTDARSLRRILRGDLDAITLKALEPDPDRRYAAASELAADIERFSRREPVLARTPTLRYRLSSMVRRNRLVFTGIAAVVAALAIGLAGMSLLYRTTRAQRDAIFRLSDRIVLARTVEETEGLWPPTPELAPSMERWLEGDARELAERLPLHRATLDDLKASGHVAGRPSGSPAFADADDEFQYELLENLVRRLEDFADEETGTIARMRQRLSFARAVDRLSLIEPADAWAAAIEAIADPRVAPSYRGLQITPQRGLVPLGPDPRSGFWEFAHLQTGTAPVRNPAGELVRNEDTGIVLILLPPGALSMGAEGPSFGFPLGSRRSDPGARRNEAPIHTVEIPAPFFISKYEMTQGQWIRINHENPADMPAGVTVDGKTHTLMHPVEKITWHQAADTMRRAGLMLPTEAQWEYAARGGTSTRFWTGDTYETLEGTENLADLSYGRRPDATPAEIVPWDDGYGDTSPVGTYRPNPFGLHDVGGNVCEWCRDRLGSYDAPTFGPDAERRSDDGKRVFRGGDSKRSFVRISRRVGINPDTMYNIGVRPARAVEGAWSLTGHTSRVRG